MSANKLRAIIGSALLATALLGCGSDAKKIQHPALLIDGYWKDVTIIHPSEILVCASGGAVTGRVESYEGEEWFSSAEWFPVPGESPSFTFDMLDNSYADRVSAEFAVESFAIRHQICAGRHK